eukprot:scaffold8161_cov111-Cylindrotheca_fusiformis.AAC.13
MSEILSPKKRISCLYHTHQHHHCFHKIASTAYSKSNTMKLPCSKSFLLAAICCAFMARSTDGFQTVPQGRISKTSISWNPPSDVLDRHDLALQASLIDPDEEPEPTESLITWKKFHEINDKFWDYTVNFFYVIMTCGIFLNLAGYAYQISPEEGLTVKTITEHRQEKQWQQELERYENEVSMKQNFMLEQSKL